MWLGLYVPRFLLQIWIFSALVWSYPSYDLQPRDNPENTAEKYFAIMKPGLPGRCEGSFVNKMVDDARTLLNNAIQSIWVLRGSDIADNERNRALANAAAQMWGAQFVQDGGFLHLVSGDNVLEAALGNYIKGAKLVKDKSIILTCGDKQWKWARTMGEAGIPTEEGDRWNTDTPIAEFFKLPEAHQYPGLWFNALLQNFASEPLEKLDANGMPNRNTFCNIGKLATETTPAKGFDMGKAVEHAHVIVICDITLNKNYIESLDDVWTKDDFSPGKIDVYNVAGVTLVHEIMHIVSREIIDQQITDANGETVAAYGWNNCVQVMRSGKALQNADNYALYAFAVTLAPVEGC